MQLIELAVIDSVGQPEAACATCGSRVGAGSGVTALFRGRTLRFRCAGCFSRFVLDADHAPDGIAATCCGGDAGHEPAVAAGATPFTEWCI
jgi:hypothetical protein